MRSPLAKARDEWLASADGVTCGDPTTLGASPLTRQYLENRLVKAFLAGANWMERQKQNGRRHNAKLSHAAESERGNGNKTL